jgi:hypothetical protein
MYPPEINESCDDDDDCNIYRTPAGGEVFSGGRMAVRRKSAVRCRNANEPAPLGLAAVYGIFSSPCVNRLTVRQY